MPYLSGLSITEFDDNLFIAGAWSIAAVFTWRSFTGTRACLTHGAGRLLTGTGLTATVGTDLLTNTGVKTTLATGHRLTGARCIATGLATFWR